MRKMATLVVLALFGACGGDDGGAVSLEDFPDQALRSFCQNGVVCGLYPDVETCLDSRQAIDVAQALADAEAGLLEPDREALATCAAVEQTCDRQFNTTPFDIEQIQACIDSVRGTLPDGEPCTAFSQCAGGVCARPDTCDPADACCEGTCASGSVPVAGQGEDCFVLDCDVGLYCAIESDGMSFSLTCQPQVQPGQSCLQPDACSDGYWCNSVDGETAGTCDPVAGPGETCAGDSVTRNNGCVDITTYCDSTTSACEPRSEAGEACDDNVRCLFYAFCNAGTCETRPLEGETCDAEAGPPCLGQLDCLDSGVCGFPATTDAPICTI